MDGAMPLFFRGNPTFFIVMGVIVATQVLIVQYGGSVFNTVPLSTALWVKIVVLSASVLVVGFVIRAAFRHFKSGHTWLPA
jgi:Ca2+-transporting ATPase